MEIFKHLSLKDRDRYKKACDKKKNKRKFLKKDCNKFHNKILCIYFIF